MQEKLYNYWEGDHSFKLTTEKTERGDRGMEILVEIHKQILIKERRKILLNKVILKMYDLNTL